MRKKRKLLSEMNNRECCRTLEKAWMDFEKRKQPGWGDMPMDLRTGQPVTDGRPVKAKKAKYRDRIPRDILDQLKFIGPTLKMFDALDEEMRVK